MKKIIIRLLAPVVAWWLAAVDEESENEVTIELIMPEAHIVPGLDAGIPTG